MRARLAVLVLCCVTSVACSTVGKVFPKKADYRQSKTVQSLEVPPDLTAAASDESMAVPDLSPAATASYSTYASERAGPVVNGVEQVLVRPDNIRVARDGNQRWLVINADPSVVWSKMREFWLQNGFLVKREDPRIGILETGWAENRADIPLDPLRKVLSKALDTLYSTPTRDMFRVRLERGDTPRTTLLFLTHRGVEEVVEGDSTVWQPRPSDPELEAEMLSRLMVYMGVEQKKAQRMLAAEQPQAPRAQLIRTADGGAELQVQEDLDRAWRRTGVALDRVGFTVEDRDRSRGVYYVRYSDPLKEQHHGILSKLAFWKQPEPARQDEYQISLTEQGAGTRVAVLDKSGEPENSPTAARILTLLQEQLK